MTDFPDKTSPPGGGDSTSSNPGNSNNDADKSRYDNSSVGQDGGENLHTLPYVLTGGIALVVIAGVYFGLELWMVPHHEKLSPRELSTAVADARRNTLALFALIGALFTVLFAAMRHELDTKRHQLDRKEHELSRQTLKLALDSRQLDRDAAYMSRYTTAVEQLASEKQITRLAGIWSLDEIARNFDQDRQKIINLLCVWLRESGEPDGKPDGQFEKVSADREAALSVIAKCYEYFPERDVDLSHVNLNGFKLSSGDLHGAILVDAFVKRVEFFEVNFEGAIMRGIMGEEAKFMQSTLNGVTFAGADLTETSFRDCECIGTNFNNATLNFTVFRESPCVMATFLDSYLEHVKLYAADLSAALIRPTYMNGCILNESVLTDAHVSPSKMSSTSYDGAHVGGIELKQNQLENLPGDNVTLTEEMFTNKAKR